MHESINRNNKFKCTVINQVSHILRFSFDRTNNNNNCFITSTQFVIKQDVQHVTHV